MQIHTVPEYEISIDPFIHVSREISTLLSCEIVGFPGLNVLFVCLFVVILGLAQRGCQSARFLFPLALYQFA